VLALLAVLAVFVDIAGSVRLWRVAVSSGMFGAAPFDPAASAVTVRADPAYTTIVSAGAAMTLATTVVLAVLAYRDRSIRRPHPP
jgi:hypothetical protein